MDIGLQRLTIRAQQTTASTRLAGTCLLLLDVVDACDFAEVSEQEINIRFFADFRGAFSVPDYP